MECADNPLSRFIEEWFIPLVPVMFMALVAFILWQIWKDKR